jgi:uncharacterized protein (TIGR02391 family)
MSQEQIDALMKNFPPPEQILQMEVEELAPHLLRYMLKTPSMAHRYNFAVYLPSGAIAECFMEAWGWLEHEGFIAPRANDTYGMDFFVTRKGRAVAATEDFEAWRKAHLFPDDLDPAIVRYVKPLFLRGDYDTAVFRAFKEVEVRVRKKAGFQSEYGRELMLKAFGDGGPLKADNKEERKAARELFGGAISFFKNRPSHHEIQFENPREVVDMICFANQLLRIVERLPSPS